MTSLDFIILGFIGGVTPGPITALMLGETFANGIKSAIKIPIAIICSNLVIAPLVLVMINFGVEIGGYISLLTIAGGSILVWLGVNGIAKNFNKNFFRMDLATSRKPFRKAFLLDLVNPHPYIFWFTILGPSIVILSNGNYVKMAYYGMFFVGALVVTKVFVLLLANQFKKILSKKYFRYILIFLDSVLLVFGIRTLLTLL